MMSKFIAFIATIFCGFKQFDISLGTAGVGPVITGSRVLCSMRPPLIPTSAF